MQNDVRTRKSDIYDLKCKNIEKIGKNWRKIKMFKNYVKKDFQDGGEIGGSRVHFSLHMGETPSQYTEEQSEQPTVAQCLWR